MQRQRRDSDVAENFATPDIKTIHFLKIHTLDMYISSVFSEIQQYLLHRALQFLWA